MARHNFTHSGVLARLILRLDRLRIPIWLISIIVITLAVAASFTELYGSDAERQVIAETMQNPAMIAMIGPLHDLENYTLGAMFAHEMLLFTALAVALMNILLVTRHTRADEEEGRLELIRSLPVGRLAHLQASMLVYFYVNLVLALLVGLGLYGLQLESMDLNGSLVYGFALGAAGFFFAALTAVVAQLSESARGTLGISFALLMVAYLLRAIGDVSDSALSWFSPLGWAVQTKAYVTNEWWPVLLSVIVSILLIGVAFGLNARRDLESGLIPAKPGKKRASTFLQSPLGLLLRLQRTSLIAWAIGMVLLGASYGSVFGDLEAFFANMEVFEQLLNPAEGYSLLEQFIPMLISVMAMIAAIPVIMTALKPMSEEKKQRIEHLFARAVSRTHVILVAFLSSVVISLIMLTLTVLGLWGAGTSVMEEGLSFGTLFGAAMAYLPALWLMSGVAIVLVGTLPQWTNLSWLYLLYSFIVVYLGGLMQFPEWMAKLSPFGHVSQLPIEEMNYGKAVMMTVIAIVLALIGVIRYNQRDIQA